ncbi:MAG: response regulator [Pseudomonadota bacterium]
MLLQEDITILIVDDFLAMRRLIKRILKDIGYLNILEASDGNEALEVLRTKKVNLILADWNMPNMDGLALLRNVKENVELKKIPFIMITAEGIEDKVVEAAKLGVTNYIVKPFTPQIIISKVEQALKGIKGL